MKNLEKFGVQELGTQEMKVTQGGGNPIYDFIFGYVGGKIIDGYIWCAKETHRRRTLMKMNQVDVKLWN